MYEDLKIVSNILMNFEKNYITQYLCVSRLGVYNRLVGFDFDPNLDCKTLARVMFNNTLRKCNIPNKHNESNIMNLVQKVTET